jgi:hypothetical protein
MAKTPSVRGRVRQAGGTHGIDFPTLDEPHGAYPGMQGPGKRLNVTGNHFLRVVDAFKRACLFHSTEGHALQPPTPASGWDDFYFIFFFKKWVLFCFIFTFSKLQ